MKRLIILTCLVTSLLFECGCSDSNINSIPPNRTLLQYKLTMGWSNTQITIIVHTDMSAVKIYNNIEQAITFSTTEQKKLDIALANFNSYKRFYKPEHGIWFDIPMHEIIYSRTIEMDTVSIHEPLDSPEIPETLKRMVEMLMDKLEDKTT